MKRRAITYASAAFFVTSLALASDTWILDSGRSNARLFQGSRANSDAVNPGVARVTGKVKLDANDLDASFFELSFYPADVDWGHALSPEGTLSTGYVPDSTDQTLLTFKSTRILRIGNGQLAVIGNLTLTRVERPVIATPTEDYAGSVYGNPVIHNETRALCTGTLVEATRDDNCDTPAPVGEDHSGPQCTPAAGNEATIVLDLKFLHAVPEASVGMLLESGETR